MLDVTMCQLAAEVPAISVADLKKRFEKSSAGPLSPMLPVEGSGSRGSSGGMQKRPSGFVAAPTDVQRLSAASSSIKREVDALVKVSQCLCLVTVSMLSDSARFLPPTAFINTVHDSLYLFLLFIPACLLACHTCIFSFYFILLSIARKLGNFVLCCAVHFTMVL